VLTLEKADESTNISVPTAERQIDELLTKEWLLTNGRGGYASSTVVGCNTRAYHGLLIGSLNPPAQRIMALSNCLEMIISGAKVFNLSTFEFPDRIAPAGFGFLKRFRRDIGAHFDYKLAEVDLTRSVFLVRDTDTVAIVYNFTRVRGPVQFVSRPFIGLRNFHGLQKSYATLCSKWLGSPERGLLVRHGDPNCCDLLLSCPYANFEKDPQWWFNFTYRQDRERGQAFTEDLWAPGFYKCRIDSPAKIVLWASLKPSKAGHKSVPHVGIETACRNLLEHQKELKHQARSLLVARRSWLESRDPSHESRIDSAQDGEPVEPRTPLLNEGAKNRNLRIRESKYFEMMCLAADQFVTKRQTNNKTGTTIVAGYPWFADWGRDAFISLPGMLLVTGRFELAKSVLATFAAAAEDGMIPNRFDEYDNSTHFNSVDASLWFINAAFQYLRASDDSNGFTQQLVPTIRWIIDSYRRGTRFGIHADEDGLITAGDEQTQLTWMDAKCDGIAFTPRYGKAVEVNALWYNCLCLMAGWDSGLGTRDWDPGPQTPYLGVWEPEPISRKYGEMGTQKEAKRYQSLAEMVRSSFCELFWNDKGYLNDCILPDGSIDDRLRPNQIFAVSLKYSPLSENQQASVVEVVQKHLLTPYGLRTLSPDADGYVGEYTGPLRQRDQAYHQGTVWPYLIGPFIEAYLKVNEFSPESKNQAAEFVEPLLRHLSEDGCLANISEIFDGDEPHKPKGCFAQAWSVAELIRACRLIGFGPR
jgi:glycogen debranching enzyme